MPANPELQQIEEALPSYEIGVELGRGAWGVVLSGRHRALGRQVAIKQLPRSFGADAAVAGRFLREAQMAASLDHPHIVPVYDYVERDGLGLIVMEQCATTVGARFHADGLHTDEACYAALATCSALDYAHGRGVLHRDIKPENLLVDTDGVVKLGDFGIARAVDEATRLTATGTVIGTPAYMSPEQASGQDLGPTSDVYSIGVVIYELLSGSLPFADVSSFGALIRQHLTEPPRPILDVASDLPTRIAEAVDRALAKDPDERWPSAAAFGVALGEATSQAFGAGWPRQRRFSLLGAPEIVAATEREIGGDPRPGSVHVGGQEATRPPTQPTTLSGQGPLPSPSLPTMGNTPSTESPTPAPTGQSPAPPAAPGNPAPTGQGPSPAWTPPSGGPAPTSPPPTPSATPAPNPTGPTPSATPPPNPTGPPPSATPPPNPTATPPGFATPPPSPPAAAPPAPAPAAPHQIEGLVAPAPFGARPAGGPPTMDDRAVPPGPAGPPTTPSGFTPDGSGGGGGPRVVLIAVAAGIVLIVGALVAVALTGGDEGAEPPATSTPTSTPTAPPGTDQPPVTQAPVVTGEPALVLGALVDAGEFSTDEDQQVAIELAVADIQAAGGVLGRPLVVRPGGYTDDASLIALAGEHLASGAVAVIGPSDPVDTPEVLDLVTSGGAVLVSPTDFFSRPGGDGLYFQTRIPNTLVGEAAVSLLPDGADEVVLLRSDSFLASELVVEAIADAINDAGADATVIEVTEGSFAQVAGEVADVDPDAVMLYGIIDKTGLYTSLIDAGIGPQSVPYVVVADDGGALDLADGAITGVRGINADFLTGNALEERIPASNISASAAQAYDAVIILALAAEAAGTTEAEAIAEWLPLVTGDGDECTSYAQCRTLLADGADIDYRGPGGTYDLSADNGRPLSGLFQVSTIGDTGLTASREQVVYTRPS